MKLTKSEALEKRNPTEAQRAKVDKKVILKIFLLILSIAGFFDASYLTILHYKNVIPPCQIAKGCETVLTSQYAMTFGVPIALLGSLFFLMLIFFLLLGFYKYFKLLTFGGVIVSVILIFIQAFILHAFCQYCLLSEVIIFAIFALSFFAL